MVIKDKFESAVIIPYLSPEGLRSLVYTFTELVGNYIYTSDRYIKLAPQKDNMR